MTYTRHVLECSGSDSASGESLCGAPLQVWQHVGAGAGLMPRASDIVRLCSECASLVRSFNEEKGHD